MARKLFISFKELISTVELGKVAEGDLDDGLFLLDCAIEHAEYSRTAEILDLEKEWVRRRPPEFTKQLKPH